MSSEQDPKSDEFIATVVAAFDHCQVPPAPSTIEALHTRPHAAPRLTLRRRLVVSGVTLSTLAGIILVALWLTSGQELSAMERMARKLHEVKSLSYQISTRNTFLKPGEMTPTAVIRKGTAIWQAPAALRAEEKIWHRDVTAAPQDPGKLVVHVIEILPPGKPGIFINYLDETFAKLPVMRDEDIPPYSPLNQLRMVRERRGRILKDLGTKMIGKTCAHGYQMAMDGAEADSGRDRLEVWVDPRTDLPMEFGYTIRNEDGPEFFRVTDCRWNYEIRSQSFDTTVPVGYREIPPPSASEP